MEQESLHDYLDKAHLSVKGLIGNDLQANRVVLKVEELRDQKRRNKALAKAEQERIKKWLDGANGELDQQITYYRNLLHQYIAYLRKIKKDPTLNTLKLPFATLTFHKQKSTWNYNTEHLIPFFLETNQPQFVHVKLNKENMRKYFKEKNTSIYDPKTGRPLKGVNVEQKGEYFTVKRK